MSLPCLLRLGNHRIFHPLDQGLSLWTDLTATMYLSSILVPTVLRSKACSPRHPSQRMCHLFSFVQTFPVFPPLVSIKGLRLYQTCFYHKVLKMANLARSLSSRDLSLLCRVAVHHHKAPRPGLCNQHLPTCYMISRRSQSTGFKTIRPQVQITACIARK